MYITKEDLKWALVEAHKEIKKKEREREAIQARYEAEVFLAMAPYRRVYGTITL